jgi:tetratricopeptide (TPR) repeat protein
MFARLTLISMLLAVQPITAQDSLWQADLKAAQEALAARKYDAAVEKFQSVLKITESSNGQEAGTVQSLRGLGTVYRLQGKLGEAANFLNRAVRPMRVTAGDDSLELADLMSELALVQRAYGARDLAIGTLVGAIDIRGKHPDTGREALARDLTLLGILQIAAEDRAGATPTLKQALGAWDAAVAPDDVRILPVLDALAGLYRDGAEYSEAEPLLLRALGLREMAAGTDSADVIATVDSLSYVYFGMKKYVEAEPFYKRLLALWETSAGPEHPMVALTLEKMGVFYSAQEKYAEAEPLFERSLTIRTNAMLQSINHKGRVQVMQAKVKEAEDLYKSAIVMAENFKIPDEMIDGMLRIYSKVLQQAGKTREAKAVDDRIRAALIRKADREGARRPLPPGAKPLSRE